MAALQASESAGRTIWWRRETPLRQFLSTETGSAAVLLVAAVIALGAWGQTGAGPRPAQPDHQRVDHGCDRAGREDGRQDPPVPRRPESAPRRALSRLGLSVR